MSAYSDGEVVMSGRSRLGNSLPIEGRHTFGDWSGASASEKMNIWKATGGVCFVLSCTLAGFVGLLQQKQKNQLFKRDPDWCILLVKAYVFVSDGSLCSWLRTLSPQGAWYRDAENFFPCKMAGGLQDHPVALQHRIPSSLADIVVVVIKILFLWGWKASGRNVHGPNDGNEVAFGMIIINENFDGRYPAPNFEALHELMKQPLLAPRIAPARFFNRRSQAARILEI